MYWKEVLERNTDGYENRVRACDLQISVPAVKENHIPHAAMKILGVADQEKSGYIYRNWMAEGKDVITRGVRDGPIDR